MPHSHVILTQMYLQSKRMLSYRGHNYNSLILASYETSLNQDIVLLFR